MSVATASVQPKARIGPDGGAEDAAPFDSSAVPAQSGPAANNGRLHDASISDTDRTYCVFIHLSPFAFVLGLGPLSLLLPVILWVVRKDQSSYNDDHGREVVNFGLSIALFHVLLTITIIGAILIPVLWIVVIVNLIRGAVAGGRGEYFRYPITIRFLS